VATVAAAAATATAAKFSRERWWSAATKSTKSTAATAAAATVLEEVASTNTNPVIRICDEVILTARTQFAILLHSFGVAIIYEEKQVTRCGFGKHDLRAPTFSNRVVNSGSGRTSAIFFFFFFFSVNLVLALTGFFGFYVPVLG